MKAAADGSSAKGCVCVCVCVCFKEAEDMG